eukprot:TRINITY_DN574_c0_g1_i9.p1 TRINITY_DN574_c0_g1~~TRINITY_DN574_c0_g1_i9.p1  ORF type:complete len:421 (-),score=51.62 TRINITY_DN574_c0_g1_i9:81-1343(-)
MNDVPARKKRAKREPASGHGKNVRAGTSDEDALRLPSSSPSLRSSGHAPRCDNNVSPRKKRKLKGESQLGAEQENSRSSAACQIKIPTAPKFKNFPLGGRIEQKKVEEAIRYLAEYDKYYETCDTEDEPSPVEDVLVARGIPEARREKLDADMEKLADRIAAKAGVRPAFDNWLDHKGDFFITLAKGSAHGGAVSRLNAKLFNHVDASAPGWDEVTDWTTSTDGYAADLHQRAPDLTFFRVLTNPRSEELRLVVEVEVKNRSLAKLGDLAQEYFAACASLMAFVGIKFYRHRAGTHTRSAVAVLFTRAQFAGANLPLAAPAQLVSFGTAPVGHDVALPPNITRAAMDAANLVPGRPRDTQGDAIPSNNVAHHPRIGGGVQVPWATDLTVPHGMILDQGQQGQDWVIDLWGMFRAVENALT